MSLPTVQSHVADITNVDVNTISFDLPASIPLGAGIICLIGAWDDDDSTGISEDDTIWTRLDTAANNPSSADAIVFARVAGTANEGGTTVLVDVDSSNRTATAIVHVFVITNWWGSFETGFATVPHFYIANAVTPKEYSSPAITVSWPSSDQHLVFAWAVAGRANVAFTATPAGYTTLTNNISSVTSSNRGINTASGYKELSGLTDDPGNWSNDETFIDRYAGTFAIRGASTAPTVTIANGDLEPGKAITCTASNFTSAPTALTATDADSNSISSASEITDLVVTSTGGDSYSFTFTMPARITSGTGTTLLRGPVTLELT